MTLGAFYPAFNSNNFAGSSALAEVCTLLSAVLVVVCVTSCSRWLTAAWCVQDGRCNETGGPDKPQDKYTRLVDEADGVEERLIENGQVLLVLSFIVTTCCTVAIAL